MSRSKSKEGSKPTPTATEEIKSLISQTIEDKFESKFEGMQELLLTHMNKLFNTMLTNNNAPSPAATTVAETRAAPGAVAEQQHQPVAANFSQI